MGFGHGVSRFDRLALVAGGVPVRARVRGLPLPQQRVMTTKPAPASATHWRQLNPMVHRAFRCRCGRPVFFGNTRCVACDAQLGYDATSAAVWPLQSTDDEGVWRRDGDDSALRYRRCANFGSALVCSWLIEVGEAERFEQCRSCRLNRTLPDLTQADNQQLWARVESDKQRLVASLIALQLPVASRTVEDTERGLAFDLLRGTGAALPVITGHLDGVITLDIDEADDARREAIRKTMDEPYRTVLGHLRHESGHYYWARLIEHGAWLEPFRALFGDERADYAAALQRHHAEGPPAGWDGSFVRAYASSQPGEDWAETWAHYLHILDTLDTALSFGLDAARSGLLRDPFKARVLFRGGPAPREGDEPPFLALINAWIELTGVLNELSRSMGEHDFYPFVLSDAAVTKLHFVHRVMHEAGHEAAPPQVA
jgi:hypothetical protein